ncbi:hypothetical protein SAMN05660657_05325 [Geodermatophilus amargosae]|uniref:N-acetyltransferase domain-containing protein n=1 Tax=Geodermatophilus amargosae TaxID=1296565 RepID=A0A1I7D5B6_9ACTN|nr:hypothetical protein [Geodermatophilus amargosae]SFU06855.1 hypothetical protein SAMN05660657_05325 [Geodermatophilus amargosae]
MFSFRDLHTEAEHREFLNQFCAELARRSAGALELTIPTSRIERCTRVVGVFDRAGAMVGGYIVNLGPELILLSVVPQGPRQTWLQRVPLEQQAELNLIWRNEGIGHTAFALLVWTRIIYDCVRCGRPVILGSGYENPLNRWYKIMGPEMIYAGPATSSGLTVYVYAYSRAKLIGTYAASFVDSFAAKPLRRLRGRR